MANKGGERPTHKVRIWDPDSGAYTNVGAAWERDSSGAISVKLGPGVTISAFELKTQGLKLMLLPDLDGRRARSDSRTEPAPPPPPDPGLGFQTLSDDDDDIPF